MESDGIVKQARLNDQDKAASIMEAIRSENPSNWPHGLTVDHFSPGNLWLIQKSAAGEPVGFVGWQARKEGGVDTGYYSIGVLPEYRHQGVAKKAVAQLLATKAASVHQVRALVVAGNLPSERLAQSLEVPMVKAAGIPPWIGKTLKSPLSAKLVGGTGTMLFQDNIMRADREGHHPFSSITDVFQNDTRTNLINGLNFGLGSWGGRSLQKGTVDALAAKKIRDAVGATTDTVAKGERLLADAHRMSGNGVKEMALGAISKDLLLDSHNAISGISSMGKSAPDVVEAIKELAARPQATSEGLGTPGTIAAASILALALGGGAYGISRALKNKSEAPINIQCSEPGGRIKVTLPTKNPNDGETTVDLPFDQFQALSPALRQRIERDTRRRLYGETNARTRRIGTQPLTAVN